MNCPVCNAPDAHECAEEVDIGVGVQKFVWGYECRECGQIPVCPHCGGLGDKHAAWCVEAKGN